MRLSKEKILVLQMTLSMENGGSTNQGSQNRGKPVGYRGNRPNRAGSVTKTNR
jgi:hypothetical protein